MDDDRFLELVARCLSGEAGEDEQRELIGAAAASPERSARLVEQVRLDAALRAHARDVDGFVGRVRMKITAKGRSAAFSAAVRRRFEGERRRFGWGWARRLWPLALAVGLIIGVGVWSSRGDDVAVAPTATPLAVVVEATVGVEVIVDGRAVAAAVGATIAPGDRCRTAEGARLVVRLADGSTLATLGAASWSPVADAVRLDAGAVMLSRSGDGPRAPFAVTTPSGAIAIHASRCTIAAGPAGAEIEALDGAVRVVRVADGSTVSAGADDIVVATVDGGLAVRPRRVRDHLLGLWLFDAGAGALVRDLSGRSPPLDLTIADVGHATWRPDGLRVAPMAGLAAAIAADVSPIAQRRGLTIECWAVAEPGDNDRLQVLELDTESRFTSTGHSLTPGRLCHLVLVVYAEGGRCLVEAWRDGEMIEDVRDIGEAALIGRLAGEAPRLNVATADDPAAVPGVELRLLAMYAGPLDAAAIRRNHAAGVPISSALLRPRPRDDR